MGHARYLKKSSTTRTTSRPVHSSKRWRQMWSVRFSAGNRSVRFSPSRRQNTRVGAFGSSGQRPRDPLTKPPRKLNGPASGDVWAVPWPERGVVAKATLTHHLVLPADVEATVGRLTPDRRGRWRRVTAKFRVFRGARSICRFLFYERPNGTVEVLLDGRGSAANAAICGTAQTHIGGGVFLWAAGNSREGLWPSF